jgi:hypothetical protein
VELELFKTDDIAYTFTHVMVLAPLLGQLLLVFTLFQNVPGRRITLIGIVLLSVLVLLIFLIGILGLNYKIFLSTLPFLISAVFFFVKRKSYK